MVRSATVQYLTNIPPHTQLWTPFITMKSRPATAAACRRSMITAYTQQQTPERQLHSDYISASCRQWIEQFMILGTIFRGLHRENSRNKYLVHQRCSSGTCWTLVWRGSLMGLWGPASLGHIAGASQSGFCDGGGCTCTLHTPRFSHPVNLIPPIILMVNNAEHCSVAKTQASTHCSAMHTRFSSGNLSCRPNYTVAALNCGPHKTMLRYLDTSQMSLAAPETVSNWYNVQIYLGTSLLAL